jgi:SAM-dependent methyltransferase
MNTTIEQTHNSTKVLQELVMRLSRLGYSEFYASFNPAAPLSYWQRNLEDLPPYLAPFVHLFMLGEPVDTLSVESAIGDLLPTLCELELLTHNAEKQVITNDLVLLPVLGNWLFFQKPQPDPYIYFGDDSIALLLRLRPQRYGRCLDLCSGPGIQALHCSLFASEVAAVEINPKAAKLARLNVLMNGREQIVSVYNGDLYEPVAGQVFDTIVANPPLLPFPDDIPYPFVGHGGADGIRVVRRILNGFPTALAKDGVAQIIGTCLSKGRSPLIADELDRWASEHDMDVLLTVTSLQPLAPGTTYFDGLVATSATSSNVDPQVIQTAFAQLLKQTGANFLSGYFLHIRHGSGKLHIQNLAQMGAAGLWYI